MFKNEIKIKFRMGSKTLVRSLVLVFKRLKQLSKLNVFVIKVLSHERKKKSIQVSFIILLGITNLNWFMEYLAEEIISLKNITCFFFVLQVFASWIRNSCLTYLLYDYMYGSFGIDDYGFSYPLDCMIAPMKQKTALRKE